MSTPVEKLIEIVAKLANTGSVEDYTVAGIRAELRDALYAYKYRNASIEPPKPPETLPPGTLVT